MLDELINGAPHSMVEAVTSAYYAIFEGSFYENNSFADISGSRKPAMTEFGQVDNVGAGKHKVKMVSEHDGYSIDGKHVGWTNPQGSYKTAVAAQDAFVQSYAKKIKSACPDLPDTDVQACAGVMGDYDGLWYFMYDNGSRRKNRYRAGGKLREFGKKVNVTKDADVEDLHEVIENLVAKYADSDDNELTSKEIASWFKKRGIELTPDQLRECLQYADEIKSKYRNMSDSLKAITADGDYKLSPEQLKEMTRTDQPFDNTPADPAIIKNIARMAALLKKIREETGLDVSVNSCYRSPRVNQAVNGAKNSSHLSGLAMDLTTGNPQNNRKLYAYLSERLKAWPIDQLIMYNTTPRVTRTPIRFVHVGLANNGEPRHQALYL